jgi:hypothetical protein
MLEAALRMAAISEASLGGGSGARTKRFGASATKPSAEMRSVIALMCSFRPKTSWMTMTEPGATLRVFGRER